METEILEMLDITAPDVVEIVVRQDRAVIWINVNGLCRLRVCNIPVGQLVIQDDSTEAAT